MQGIPPPAPALSLWRGVLLLDPERYRTVFGVHQFRLRTDIAFRGLSSNELGHPSIFWFAVIHEYCAFRAKSLYFLASERLHICYYAAGY